MKNSSHYHTIAKAIQYLIANRNNQPALEELAHELNLSPSYLQRVFKDYVGISPKQFLSYLSVEALKQQLLESKNIIEAAENTGLSSQSRAYDLMLHVESLTPGEFKKQGKNIPITYGFADSSFGQIFIALNARGIMVLEFCDSTEDEFIELFKTNWSESILTRDDNKIKQLTELIFKNQAEQKHLNLSLIGTPFQIKVWKALLSIPEGALVSYSDLAQLIDNPKATRAVASAVARNPISVIIPCHRVIRNEGVIGQYHWGSERKAALIVNEYLKSRR